MADPLSRFRGRFDRAIEWRVHAAVARAIASPSETTETDTDGERDTDTERDKEIRAMRSDLATVSVQLTDQYRALAELVEQIDRRLTSLERSSQRS